MFSRDKLSQLCFYKLNNQKVFLMSYHKVFFLECIGWPNADNFFCQSISDHQIAEDLSEERKEEERNYFEVILADQNFAKKGDKFGNSDDVGNSEINVVCESTKKDRSVEGV